ncbi:MAG TPA: glycosyltransferase family 2 protein [Dissulfurispiraceae bacterium]|nr:glycosyltransferase family 2 protein [Dissulfurispiraceae bacterium]
MKPEQSLSVAIIALNEEDRLPACLESVRFADEVVVVDSGSTDRTVAIAEASGCRVYVEDWKGFGRQKQSAVDKCRHNWVLIIDADERVPPETAAAICTSIQDAAIDGCSFPRKNFFNGKWIRSCGWWPDRVVRLFRRDRGNMKDVLVHETVHVRGVVVDLDTPLYHYPIRSLSDVLVKINRYSSLGAEKLYQAGGRSSVFKAAIKGIAAFMKTYFLQRGVFGGAEGFILSFSHGVYTCYKYLKLCEKKVQSHES